MFLKKYVKNKEIRNATWLIGEQIFQMLISLIIGILTARYLGPQNYGSLSYTASFVSFFTSIATLGMEGVVIKKLIEHPELEGEYLGTAMLFRVISAILSSIMIAVIVFVLNPEEDIKVILALLQSIQLVFQAVYILDSWFQRYFISRYVSIGKMIASIVVAIYKVYLLITAKSIAWFAFSNSLSYIVISIMIYIFYQNQKGPKLSIKLSTGIEMLKESYHFILSGIMAAAYGQMDRIMIGQMMTNADVGLYTTATAICSMWIFVPNAIINSFRPTIMEVKKNGNEHLYKIRLEQLYSGIMWFCFGVSLVICICAPIVIKILYGQAYLGATNALRIAIWYEAFAMIGTARGIWILCEKKNKYVKYYLSIGAGINLVLNYTMIPYMGIEGAAMATLVTQITTSLFAPLLFKETRIHTKIVLEAFCFKWYFEKRKEG